MLVLKCSTNIKFEFENLGFESGFYTINRYFHGVNRFRDFKIYIFNKSLLNGNHIPYNF